MKLVLGGTYFGIPGLQNVHSTPSEKSSDFFLDGEWSSKPKKKEAEKLEFEAWPTNSNVRKWRVTFRTEFASGSSRPSDAKAWNNEIEEAMGIEDVRTSKSTTGQNLVDFEYLDMKIANGLMKIISGDCRRRVVIEPETAQKQKSLLTARQMGCSTKSSRSAKRRVSNRSHGNSAG